MIAEMHSYLQLFHRLRGQSLPLAPISAASFLMALLVILGLGFLGPAPLEAQQHLVPADELQEQIRAASGARETDLRDVRKFFSSSAVADRIPSALDSARLEDIVPLLDDAELARLAETTRGIEDDLKAGALTNQQLTYIVIALATAVIVIVLT